MLRTRGYFQGASTLGVTTLSITTLTIMTLGLMGLFATLSINDTYKTFSITTLPVC